MPHFSKKKKQLNLKHHQVYSKGNNRPIIILYKILDSRCETIFTQNISFDIVQILAYVATAFNNTFSPCLLVTTTKK